MQSLFISKQVALKIENYFNVAEYLSHMENRKPAASHIFMSALFQKRKMINECSDLLTKIRRVEPLSTDTYSSLYLAYRMNCRS